MAMALAVLPRMARREPFLLNEKVLEPRRLQS